MLERLKKSKNRIFIWVVIVAVLYAMTLLQIPMALRNIFLVLSTAYCLYMQWKDGCEVKWELLVLMLGLLARVVFCFLDVYTEFHLPIGGGDDGIGFMATAVEYCNGDFTRQYTKYPYVLYVIFQLAGINQFAAQYVNILCWGFSAVLVQKFCKRLEITNLFRLITVAVISWLPTNIWITSVLYRDTYVMLFLCLSFYCLLCWIQDGKMKNIGCSVAAVLAAAWFHGGSVINIIPIGLVVLFYSRKENKFLFTKRNILFCAGALVLAVILFLIPSIREVLLKKIPSMEGGLIEGLNRWLASKYDYSEGAGSNYMEGRYLTGYFDILVMTVQKIYYHMFSPVPHMWRGIVDAAAFVMSSAPIYFATLVLWTVSLFYKKFDSVRFIIFIENFVTIGVYAWGNVNGGTAVRHREKILGIMMLLAMYSLNIILQKRKERKSFENVTKN